MMIRMVFPLLVLVSLVSQSGLAQNRSGRIADEVARTFAKGKVVSIAPFRAPIGQAGNDPQIRTILSNGSLLEVDQQVLDFIRDERPEAVQMVVPQVDGPNLVLDLVISTPFAEGFQVYAASDRSKPADVRYGRYYRGIISGQPNSLAAVSFHADEMRAVIGTGTGNFVLGRLKEASEQNRYILYHDHDLNISPDAVCSAASLPQRPTTPDAELPFLRNSRLTSRCVNVYVEIDHNVYQDKGSIQASFSFLASLFHEVATLCANDTIDIALSEMVVWNLSSPYNGPSSSKYLTQFRDKTGSSFNGDIAHLVSYSASGGIAYLDKLCNKFSAKAFSNIFPYFQSVPVFSWNIMVFAHEMGHNLGSRHTHACAWNGNGTQIDDCGNKIYADVNLNPEGAACYNGNAPIMPPSGTIMSYCHLYSGIGIDMSLGFGPQPKALIQSKINSAGCLSNCNALVDSFYCFASSTSGSELWISSVSVGLFSHTSSSQDFSDFTTIGPTAFPGDTVVISLTPGYSGTPSSTHYRAWIDFNQDKDFDDPGEEVFATGPAGNTQSGSFVVPDSTPLGSSRIRIAISSAPLDGACDHLEKGEVEDYAFLITTDPCDPSDTIPPVAVCREVTLCLDSTGVAVLNPQQVDDGSYDTCADSVGFTLSQSLFGCHDIGPLTVQLTVSDSAGNSSTCLALVTIDDCLAPKISCQNVTVCLDETGTAILTPAELIAEQSDNCDSALYLVVSQPAITCSDIGIRPATVIAEDDAGLKDTCTAAITISDCELACLPTCPDTLLLDTASLPAGLYQAGDYLLATSTVLTGDSVTITAGQTIALQPGFHAQPGSHALLTIDACSMEMSSSRSEVAVTPLVPEGSQANRTAVNSPSMTVYPNPLNRSATVRYSVPTDVNGLRIVLHDLTGRVIKVISDTGMTQSGSYETQLSADGLPPGFYLLVMRGVEIHIIEKVVIGTD